MLLPALAGYFFWSAYQEVKRETIAQWCRQEMTLVEGISRGMENFFRQSQAALAHLASDDNIIDLDRQGRELMAGFYSFNQHWLKAISRVDEHGRITYTWPPNPDLVGRDVSHQPHNQLVMRTGQPVVSDVFQAIQGYPAVAVAAPVYKQNHYAGSLTALLAFQSVSADYLNAVKPVQGEQAWVCGRKGKVVFSFTSAAAGGDIADELADPALAVLKARMVKGESGSIAFSLPPPGSSPAQGEAYHAVFHPIVLGGNYWSMAVAAPESQILAVMAGFTTRWVLIMLIFTAGGALLFYLLGRAWAALARNRQRLEAEEAIRASEARFRAIFNSTFQFTGLLTPAGVIIEANQTALDFIGGGLDDVIGKFFWETPWWGSQPGLRERVREAVARAAGGEFVRLETEHLGPDGARMHIDFSLKPIRDHYGQVVLLLPEGRDITEHKRAEQDLLQRAEELAALNALGRDINATLSLDQTVQAALKVIATVLRPDLIFLFLREGDDLVLQGMLPSAADQGVEAVPVHKVGECMCGLAVAERRPLFSHDICNDSRCTWQECREAGMRSLAVLPLHSGDEVTGVLGLAMKLEHDYSQQADFLETLARQISVAITNARLFESASQELAERTRAEAALKESEERFRTLGEKSPLGICLVDAEGRYEYINPAFTKIFGYSRADITWRADWFQLAYPDDEYREKVMQKWHQDRSRPDEADLSVRIFSVRCKDGSIKTVLIKSVMIKDGREFILYEDITERTRAEMELRNSEATLRSILRGSPAGIAMVTYPERRVVWANERMAELRGYSIPELMDMQPRQAYPDEREYERATSCFRDTLESMKPCAIETRWQHQDGHVLDIYMTLAPLNQGAPDAGVVLTALDITEGKRAQDSLRKSEEKYRQILEASPDPVIQYDQDGRTLYLNPAFTRVFGWSLAELENGQVDYVPEEEKAKTHRMTEAMREGLNQGAFETRRRDKKGNVLEISLTWSAWRDDAGDLAGSVVILRDVTEQKKILAQLEQARKMEAVGTLAGGIAHDFNNVLQAISGNLQLMLMKSDLDGGQRDTLSMIDNMTHRAAEMIRQLLTLSRKQETKMVPVALNKEIEQTCKLLARIIPKMIQIDLRLDPDLWLVMADQSQFEQIILNLAGNASDAMPEGGSLVFQTENLELDGIFCRTHPELRPGPHVLLRVTDTGTGIPAEVVEHIFEPFFTTKPSGRGTGLGLSTVYGIVRNHRGLVTCYSAPNQGTVFSIYLPALSELDADQAEQAEEIKGELYGAGETILLVDDEESILAMGRDILQMNGYAVLTATSGEEALEVFERQRDAIDLVILDLNMPGMGGMSCMRRILNLDGSMKVIVSSGYYSHLTTKELEEAGAAGFLGKPYRLSLMLKRVREILDQQIETIH